MWDWVESNLITLLLLVAFLVTLWYALRLRAKMSSTSKATFAFTVCATLASCGFALLSFLNGSGPIWIGNKILSGTQAIIGVGATPESVDRVSWYIGMLGTACIGLTLILIYRFAIHAIRNWDGPVTVNVNELAKQEKDNNLGSLALAELKRLIAMKPDPIASGAAINWRQRPPEAPPAPAWHELSRSLFEAAFDEASFKDNSWRDRSGSGLAKCIPGRLRRSPCSCSYLMPNQMKKA
jgi:hypothetical protein